MNILEKIKKLKILKKIKSYRKIEGWLSPNEAYGLYKIANLLPRDSIVVEIGSWKGKSTYCLARGLRDGNIFAIDPFDASGEPGSAEIYLDNLGVSPLIDQFNNKMKSLGVKEKITPLVGYSSKFINNFEKINFLFIDGDHSIEGCNYDYVNFSPKIISGGYIAFHDFSCERDELGATWVIKNKLLNSVDYKFIGLYDSLWVAQKI